jgi:VWFA-related protein
MVKPLASTISLLLLMTLGTAVAFLAQPPDQKQKVRTVTIPISIFTKKELRENQAQEFVQLDRLIVREDRAEQQILSIRSVSDAPLSIAFIIQEDLVNNFNLQIKDIQDFIRGLPTGTRVMVAYARSGSIDVRQRFTDDREKAAKSLRIVSSSALFSPRSPYDAVEEVLGRFDAIPVGRRAILLFSDGVDLSQGPSLASITQSFDLEQAVLKAQRRGVAIYSFFTPTSASENRNSTFTFAGQGALAKISDQTGGRSFYQGSIAPTSYLPFLRELNLSLNRQFSLTYLSTNMNKGYQRVEVMSTNPDVKIEHPKGYYYR